MKRVSKLDLQLEHNLPRWTEKSKGSIVRKTTFLWMVCGLLFVLSGCGNQVQDDLLNHINNDLASIVDLETKAINEYESVTGNNYTNDEDLYLHLQDVVLPAYQTIIEEAEAIYPETQEVIDVHELI